ncbi:hypothetical protein ABW21_db0208378 [Orbilia brochopaga]|nr:hypothetical protein ABW21_db0208378 [Drechslerella brochopaga]
MATTAAPATPSSGQSSGPGGRPQIKVGSNPNMNRRNIQSPVDGGPNKRNSAHNKPWGQQNHSGGQQKYQAPNAVSNHKKPTETDTPDKHMNDRTIYLLANCVGKKVIVTTKSGSQFSGIFAGSSTNGDFGCVLKFAKQVRGPQGEEDQMTPGYFGGGPEKALVIEAKDLMDIEATDVILDSLEASSNQNGTGQFKTDVDISGNQPIRERELQRWQADDSALGGGLDDTMDPPGPEKKWDQFETNERLFGLKSDFDENIYTTRIDTSHPMHRQREAAAAKIAREIESSTGSGAGLSAHQAEERGLRVDDSGIDEEDKYSSVQRAPGPSATTGATAAAVSSTPSTSTTSGAQKYMPPALRAQVSAPPAVQTPTPVTKETPKEVAKESINETTTAAATAPASESSVSSPAASKNEGNSKKTVAAATPAVPVIPVITEQAPSPQPPSVSSFKPEESKPKDKAPLPESVKKASVAAVPAVPVLPIHKAPEASQQPNPGSDATALGTSDNPLRRVKDAFQQFTNTERERLEKRRQAMAKKDKDVKLQDLKKFAQSFKLNTPVPQDLVPILAKDKAKQDEIIEKSKVNAAAAAQSKKQTPTAQSTTGPASGIQSSLRTPIPPPPSQTSANNAAGPNQNIQTPDKNGNNKTPISGFPPRHPSGYRPDRPQPLPANMNLPPAPGARLLSDKIRHNQQMKQTGQYGNIPVPVPIVEHSAPPPTGPAAMQPKAFSPTGPKPNPRAIEFRPSPYAPVFTPGSTAPSAPTSSPAPSVNSRAPSPSVFFGSKKPKALDERIFIGEAFDPFKRMKAEVEQNKDKPALSSTDKSHMIQGFINKPWGTPPIWQVRDENQERKFSEIFDKSESSTSSATPQSQTHQLTTHQPHHGSHPSGHPIPTHISQVPPHMPHERHPGPHMPGFAGPTPHFGDQEHHGRHVSSPPNVLPSPSMQNANLPGQFGSPGPHHAMVYANPGQMPPQYTNVLGQNGQFGGYRGGYAGGPQFMQPPGASGAASPMVMGAQAQQPIPFMVPAPFIQQGLPQAMYSPHQMHAYPGQSAGPPPPPSGGYPSPGRGAPMMMHQSSQQGHQTPVPAPMMLSMSSGPAGHPPQHSMMRPFHAPPHFSQPHHPQNQYGQYPGGGRGGGHPHHAALPGHPSGPSSNIPHESAEESK